MGVLRSSQVVSTLIGRQDARGLPEVEDENCVECLMRLDRDDTFLNGDAICDTICGHTVCYGCLVRYTEKKQKRT
jgi:hypothetical protein